jgi:hypothetical protein
LADIPTDQRAEYAASRPAFEVVETTDNKRIDFLDWLAGDEGQAWLGGETETDQTLAVTPVEALLAESRRQEASLAGAARRPAIRLNIPVDVAQKLLKTNPALAWVVRRLDTRPDADPDRPSPTALAAGLLAAATLGAISVERAEPDITWQAARSATQAAADAADSAAAAVDDFRELLETLGDKIASATADAASEVARQVAARVADAAATAAVNARASDERVMLRLLASLVVMNGGEDNGKADWVGVLGSDAATRVENAARDQAAELLATDLGRAGRL